MAYLNYEPVITIKANSSTPSYFGNAVFLKLSLKERHNSRKGKRLFCLVVVANRSQLAVVEPAERTEACDCLKLFYHGK